jgi:hypothetical protein
LPNSLPNSLGITQFPLSGLAPATSAPQIISFFLNPLHF